MTSEAGTKECYAFLHAKKKLEEAIKLVGNLSHAEHVKQQLIAVHNQLEGMHELKRSIIHSKRLSIEKNNFDLSDLN